MKMVIAARHRNGQLEWLKAVYKGRAIDRKSFRRDEAVGSKELWMRLLLLGMYFQNALVVAKHELV